VPLLLFLLLLLLLPSKNSFRLFTRWSLSFRCRDGRFPMTGASEPAPTPDPAGGGSGWALKRESSDFMAARRRH
jgi:hypothetical protein